MKRKRKTKRFCPRKWARPLAKLYACREARVWCNEYPSFYAAWWNCMREDWLFWILERLAASRVQDIRDYLGEQFGGQWGRSAEARCAYIRAACRDLRIDIVALYGAL